MPFPPSVQQLRPPAVSLVLWWRLLVLLSQPRNVATRASARSAWERSENEWRALLPSPLFQICLLFAQTVCTWLVHCLLSAFLCPCLIGPILASVVGGDPVVRHLLALRTSCLRSRSSEGGGSWLEAMRRLHCNRINSFAQQRALTGRCNLLQLTASCISTTPVC